ncbi:aromatic ring-hydroxylating oxygenase subunit alpha [Plantactinospora sp. CA-290183]|uniref:aromatic ring-hydroxylating oxygenase subunit alpha n=1 Tax=Plantactinospora sp. CA-290183 TaxID=3240006 RepID=UPI003D8F5523
MFDRAERIGLLKRAIAHLRSRTTDQAPDTMLVPVEEYLDEDLWRAEIETIFKRKPQALAVSAELRNGGDYKAMDVYGVPLLMVRGHDGVVRSYLNACRHRGAQLCEPGLGNRRRFRCPYHAWVYDDHGALVAVLREETFGDIDHAQFSLRALPTVERSGIIWVTLTPDEPMDLDAWLDDFGPVLDELELDKWHLYTTQEFPGPNWKLCYDGFLEGYHFQTLHKLTFATNTITNLMVADTFGKHQRVLFGTKSLPQLLDLPESEWDPDIAAAPIYTIFPNVSIAGTWHDFAMVSQILPGTRIDESKTVQIILTKHPVESPEQFKMADAYTDMMLRGTRDEDYTVAYGAQASLGSGANSHLIFGRNELALQHQHTWLNRLVGRA